LRDVDVDDAPSSADTILESPKRYGYWGVGFPPTPGHF